MIRHPRRTVPATAVALVLLVVAVLVATSCIQLIAGRPPLIAFGTLGAVATATTWNDPVVLAAGAVSVLLGVVLLGCAILPGTPRVLALAATEGAQAGVSRTSLARDLTTHARQADGITDARVRVGARTITVDARTALRERDEPARNVHEAVSARLDQIDLARRPRLRVAVQPDRNGT